MASGHCIGSRLARTLLLIACIGPTLAAQRPGVITGTVKDESGARVPNVEVTVPKTGAIAHTDSSGRFQIARLSPGLFDVSLRRLSYAPMMLSLEVTAGDTTDVDITLTAAAETLPTTVVKGKEERKRVLEDFEQRRKLGLGHFITRTQIEARNPIVLSEMARAVPGAQLTPTNIMGRMTLRFSRRADCPPAYFLDGQYMSNFNIDDVPPRDVEGVELYAGFAGLPQQFAKQMGIQACGAVVIWTRIPGT
jgi:hypothetical protein